AGEDSLSAAPRKSVRSRSRRAGVRRPRVPTPTPRSLPCPLGLVAERPEGGMAERERASLSSRPRGGAMPVVTKEQVLELLASGGQENLRADELLEVFQEVFPDRRLTEEEVHADSWPLIEQFIAHINSGLEIDEVMNLWGVIFAKHRNVWYD